MHHKFVIYPFTAIVGQALMKKALLVNAVDPSVGGVLIKGDKGTGKSTAVRALADLLGKFKAVQGCPFGCHPQNKRLMCASCQDRARGEQKEALPTILKKMEIVDMPLSATEDMVVGSINVKRALKEGVKTLEPGLLARANRNVLYIDEVNLLDDHLVNILLDAAAMGVNVVEREGISVFHPARFMLIGTMNPEEGELRPQIIDRFGLSVDIDALEQPSERLKVLERRRRFDRDPFAFEKAFTEQQAVLKGAVFKARELLPHTELSRQLLLAVVKLTASLKIRTHRADIVMEKTARALAALEGRKEVTREDIQEAALLSLSHRMRQDPLQKTAPLDREQLQAILEDPPDGERPEENKQAEDQQVEPLQREGRLKTEPVRFNHIVGSSGRDAGRSESLRGQFVRARASTQPKSIAVDATIKKAVVQTGSLDISTEHFMEKVRQAKGKALYLLLIDASSSMRMNRKIRLAKTLSWQLLKKSYQKKNRAALIAFREKQARVLVPPTRDASKIDQALQVLPTGGKTPLSPALFKALELAGKEKEARTVIIAISDGKANVFQGASFEQDLEGLQPKIGAEADLVLVNTESPSRSLGVLEKMAADLGAEHFYLEELIQ